MKKYFGLIIFLSAITPFLLPAQQTAYIQGSGPELESHLPEGFHRLQPGDVAPDFKLIGTDDQYHTLDEFRTNKYLLVVFLSNHCPYSHAAETRLLPWIKEMKSQGLGVVAIQPNHPDALTVDELGYSKYSDSFAELKLYAAERHFNFPYLYDGETQETEKRYGALATPDLFLLDEHRKIRYSGRFDDSRFEDPKTVTHRDAVNAFNELLAGKTIAAPTTRPMGCAVKWRTKIERAATANQGDWQHEPITIAPIDSTGVAELANNPTKKLRLINVWATWCAPCVAEFPDLAKLSRRFKNRDFELITISLDQPNDKAKALKFLETQHAGMPTRIKQSLQEEHRTTNNYIYAESGTDALIQRLDPEWPGPIPHTILIAPGGKIIWRQNGEIDPAVLLHRIMDELGGFYSTE